MFSKNKGKLLKDEHGITGLETAIILIAFVMVASVFAYVVLSAGLFSSQRVKETFHSGLQEVKSTVTLKGDILAEMSAEDPPLMTRLYVTVGSMSGSDPVDFTDTTDEDNVVIVSYSDSYHQYPSLDWTMTKIVTINDDDMLDPNEFFQICVDMSTVNDGGEDATEKIGRYHSFMITITPPSGAVLTIERTVPAKVSKMINLY